MSQFRIKNIDTGVIDSWLFRIDEQGAVLGDDITARDPNELAQAISDTQELLVKTGTYAPNVLINPTEGVLSRIKTIEDTFGTTTLQDAYDNGRFISVAAGRPLSIGAIGEIELDSSGNLEIDANTFRVANGASYMSLSETGAVSANTSLTFGTTVSTIDTTLTSARDLFLKDGNLASAVRLSQSGETVLTTTAQSLVGAINEISSGFVTTDLQQIYDQSSPATITTTFGGGPVRFVNGSGNPNTPALIVDGGISTIDFIDVDTLTVGPGASVNLTIDSTGGITTVGDIETTTKLVSPRLENLSGDITLEDTRGSVTLTEIGQGTLDTASQSLVGAINEVNALADQNAASLAILDVEHDLTTGLHEIINTQSGAGQESTSRFNIKDSGGATRISMNALGEIAAEELTLGSYDVVSELALNEAHRLDDGTSHSAVAAHFADPNPHNTVKSIAKFGDTALNGEVTLSEGAGITLTRSGQDIEISTASGNTLQSVYDSQLNGDFILDTDGGKDLFFRDSSSALIMSLDDTNIVFNRSVTIQNAGAQIAAANDLAVNASSNLSIESTNGAVSIDAPNIGQTVSIEGVDWSDGTGAPAIDPSLPQDLIGALGDLALNTYTEAQNATGKTVAAGTAVVLREDGTFWIPYPDAAEASARLENPLNSDLYWHAFGVADEEITAGATGRIRTSGRISADVGKMDALTDWRVNDTLYIARLGSAEAEIVSNGSISNSDTITLDTAGAAKVYTAVSSGADPSLGQFDISSDVDLNVAADITRNNLMAALNNETYMAAGTPFYIRAFLTGNTAKARVSITGAGTAGDTFDLTPTASMPGQAISLTAIANGSTPSWLQYEVGANATETAIHLAEAINRTSNFDGPDPLTAGDGHYCRAIAYGDYIEVEWAGPGKSGDSMALSTTSAAITAPANLSGGESKVEIFLSSRGANGILCTESNAAGMTCSDFSDDEGDSQYINHFRWFSGDRIRKEDDRRIKIGKVISFVDPVLTFQVDIEEPRKNTRTLKGAIYDTEY